MLRLGVNIDHVATLRQARYRGFNNGEPCPVDAVRQAEAAGAHGITAHLREDRLHILDRDIWGIREAVQTRLNFEMANTPEMIDIALRLKPEAVCLVPENRAEVDVMGSSHCSRTWGRPSRCGMVRPPPTSSCTMWAAPGNACGQPSRPPNVASTASTASGIDMIQCSLT